MKQISFTISDGSYELLKEISNKDGREIENMMKDHVADLIVKFKYGTEDFEKFSNDY
jgi:hypothetical protein